MALKWLHGILFLLLISDVLAVKIIKCRGKPAIHVDYLVFAPGNNNRARKDVLYQGSTNERGELSAVDDGKLGAGELVFYHTCGLPDLIAERCFMKKRSWVQPSNGGGANGNADSFELTMVKKDYDDIICDAKKLEEMNP